MNRKFGRAELDDRLKVKCHLRNESRRDGTGRGSATESASTRASAKRDAEHRSGDKPEKKESHNNLSFEYSVST